MKLRVATALALAGGVVFGAPAFAIIDDGTTTEPPTTVTEPPPTATDPPTTATDPPTTSEAPPSTALSSTSTITIPTTLAEPTSTAATTPTAGPSTDDSPNSETTKPTTEANEPESDEPTASRSTTVIDEPELVAVFSGPLLLIVPLDNDQVCDGEQLTDHNDETSFVLTAPAGFLISSVCVKAGSAVQGDGPETTTYDPPVASVTVTHSSGKEISHYTVTYVPVPVPTTTTSTTTTVPPSTSTTSSSTTTTSTSSTTTSTTSTTLPPTTTTSSTTTLPPTTTTSSTTTTLPPTTTTSSTTTTLVLELFAIEVAPLCPDGTTPEIEITFGNRPDLDGQVGTLTFSTGGSIPLTFDSGGTTTIPYPASAGTGPVTMTYVLGAESVTRETSFPEACEVTTTTTTQPGTTTTTSTTTTTLAPTTTTIAPTTTTEAPKKWWVCKAVRTPGTNEIITHVISVNENAIPDPENDGVHVGDTFSDAQSTSIVIALDFGQPKPELDECFPTPPTTTTTTSTTSTTTTQPGSTTTSGPTTTFPTPGLFAIEVEPLCPDGTTPEIEITFGDRPDLDGQVGTLTFSTGGSIPLEFDANNTVTIPYPASAGTDPVTMTYVLGAESVTRDTTFPEACEVSTTTTSSSIPGPTTTSSTTSTTTSSTSTTSTTLPETFEFGAAATVCVAEVPTIRINFLNTFPELAGQTGTLTMSDINGNVVSTQPLVYEPGTTVDLLYPGTSVNPDGSIDDVPGWILTDDGFWVRDPSDEFLREGINLEYTVNPTATAFVAYPPESSACANPDGPFPPGPTTTIPGTPAPPGGALPPTV